MFLDMGLLTPSITDGVVHHNENFVETTPIFSTFSMPLLKYFQKKLKIVPQNIEKLPSKVVHNPTRPPVSSPASFFFVKLRQF